MEENHNSETQTPSCWFVPVEHSGNLRNLEDLRRIFMEAVEIAFNVCNSEGSNYGVYTLINIVSQIFPTAYVLGTAYWIYYTQTELCVCARFDLACTHERVKGRWIQYSKTSETTGFVVQRERHLVGIPINFGMNISSAGSGTYCVKTSFQIQSFASWHNSSVSVYEISPFYTIRMNFHAPFESTPPLQDVPLVPHPFSNAFYGTVFLELHNRLHLVSCHALIKIQESNLTVYAASMPKHTLVMTSAHVVLDERHKDFTALYNFTVDNWWEYGSPDKRRVHWKRDGSERKRKKEKTQRTRSRMDVNAELAAESFGRLSLSDSSDTSPNWCLENGAKARMLWCEQVKVEEKVQDAQDGHSSNAQKDV